MDIGRQIETRLANERRTLLRKERDQSRRLLQQERDQGAVKRFGRLG